MSKPSTFVDTLIVGAGHAGLAMSRCLQRKGITHLVLERARIGESWRARWDSFHLNTPTQHNLLPDEGEPSERDVFWARDRLIDALEAYRSRHELPVRCGVEVRAIRNVDAGYEVTTSEDVLRAGNVVLCTGDQNVPVVPAISADLPADIAQLHSNDYHNPSDLPEGGVLVIGSGQSGAQIAEDLLEARRATWLCTSNVGRVPRRYRGRDITDWVQARGATEQRPADVAEAERHAAQPLASGTHGGRSVSLHSLARAGATLLGRAVGIEGRTIRIGDDLLANVARGDEGAKKLYASLDAFIAQTGLDAPAAEPDPADTPCEGLEQMASVRELDLDQAGIRTVIWATGFTGNFGFLPPELLDERGLPRHTDGVCTSPGLYCLGLKWLRRRVSGLITGARQDAEFIAERIAQRG